MGRRDRRLVDPALRRRRRLGQGGRARRCCDPATRHVGHESRPGRTDRLGRALPRRLRQPDHQGDRGPRPGVHGPRAGHTDARRRRRHRVHRVVHQQPHRGPPRCCRGREGSNRHGEAGHGRAREPCREGAGDRRRARPGVHRRRRRLARAGLLDVPRHEPRQAGPRRARGEHEQPELRRSPGSRRTHTPRVARVAAATAVKGTFCTPADLEGASS